MESIQNLKKSLYWFIKMVRNNQLYHLCRLVQMSILKNQFRIHSQKWFFEMNRNESKQLTSLMDSFVWRVSNGPFQGISSMNQSPKCLRTDWNGRKRMCLSMSDSHLCLCVVSISLTLEDVIVKDWNWWLTCSIRSLIQVLRSWMGKLFGKIWPWRETTGGGAGHVMCH